MTTIYFVRHAEPDYSNHDDENCPLTEKGFKDRELVTEFLEDKDIQILLSSPYIKNTTRLVAEKL
jgi:2,3-bisphosphoglycerate-dependent phosphoglycerate mutase